MSPFASIPVTGQYNIKIFILSQLEIILNLTFKVIITKFKMSNRINHQFPPKIITLSPK